MSRYTLKKFVIFSITVMVIGVSLISNVNSKIQIKKNGIQNEGSPLTISLDTDWWPMFRHDLARNGYTTSKAPDTNTLFWNYSTGNKIYSSPSVANGKVLVSSSDEHKMYCLNASNGIKEWEFRLHEDMSPAAIVNDRVYFGSDNGYVYCLNATTGNITWSTLTDAYAQL